VITSTGTKAHADDMARTIHGGCGFDVLRGVPAVMAATRSDHRR
jgi:hypothetical protein